MPDCCWLHTILSNPEQDPPGGDRSLQVHPHLPLDHGGVRGAEDEHQEEMLHFPPCTSSIRIWLQYDAARDHQALQQVYGEGGAVLLQHS